MMTDLQAHLNKIRSDAAECRLLSSLATDGKGEVFAKTAEHLNALASDLEKTIATNSADKGARGENLLEPRPADHEELVEAEIAVTRQPAARPSQMLLLLSVGFLGGIVAAFFWANNPVNGYRSLSSIEQLKPETTPVPTDEAKNAIATLLSDEQVERKRLVD